MTTHVTMHVPSDIKSLDELSGEKFLAKKNTNGAVKTIDLYYRGHMPESKKKGFLEKLTNFFKKLSDYKSASKSMTLGNALTNIRDNNCSLHWKADPNLLMSTAKDVLNSPNMELHKNGVTFTIKGWTVDQESQRLQDMASKL